MTVPSLIPEQRTARARARGRFSFALTGRSLALLFAGSCWFAPAFFFHPLVWAVPLWDLLILFLAAIDLASLPSAAGTEVRRTWHSVVTQGAPAAVELSFFYQGKSPLRLSVIDDLSPALLEEPQRLRLVLPPGRWVRLPYRFTARERGDHPAGKTYLRYQSRLGLAERWSAADLSQTVRIYPSSQSAVGEMFAARTRQVEQQLQRRRHRGLGREFESLRDYREGDDPRDICWTASARRGALVSRQYESERGHPVWIVLDAGRLLSGRIGRWSRLDYSAAAAAALCHLALQTGDRCGVLAYGRRIQQRVAPGRGGAHLRQLIDALALVHSEPGDADHMRAAMELSRTQSRRSLILWLTDLAETAATPEVLQAAAMLMRHHLVLLVAIRAMDVEAIAAARPRNFAAMYRGAAAQELLYRRQILLSRLRRQGGLTLETSPGELTTAVLNRYLEVKEKSLL